MLIAAALIASGSRMLLTRRRPGTHLAGTWEFPGGKVEAEETPAGALAREIREELGVDVYGLEPFTFTHHRYADRDILLLLFRCSIKGTPRCLEAAALDWFTLEQARSLPMPEADLPLLDEIARRSVLRPVRQRRAPSPNQGSRSRTG